MKKIALIFVLIVFILPIYSQTECEYNVSFYLKSSKGKLIKKIYKKEIDKASYIGKYFTKNKKHYVRVGQIGGCEYQLTLRKRGKKLILKFHNTKEFQSFVSLGTLPLIDTVIHFYDGLKYKALPITELKDEMSHPVVIPKKELPFKFDTTNICSISEYGGFKNVKAELIINRLGIETDGNPNEIILGERFNFRIREKFDIYSFSETEIKRITEVNESFDRKLNLGKVYQLTFTELKPQRTMIVAFFGTFQVQKHVHISNETIENFAKTNNCQIVNTKNVGVDWYTLVCSTNDLREHYKRMVGSGLFQQIEPSFWAVNENGNRGESRGILKPDRIKINEEIDSVVFYSIIMNDLPANFNEGAKRCVITHSGIYSIYLNQNKLMDINRDYRVKLSNYLFQEAKFMLNNLPNNYLDSTGSFGNCLVNVNQTSNYNCFTMIIYKNDGTQLFLQGNELPRDLTSYYYQAYRYNNRLRKLNFN